jgi:hypothetical protein
MDGSRRLSTPGSRLDGDLYLGSQCPPDLVFPAGLGAAGLVELALDHADGASLAGDGGTVAGVASPPAGARGLLLLLRLGLLARGHVAVGEDTGSHGLSVPAVAEVVNVCETVHVEVESVECWI